MRLQTPFYKPTLTAAWLVMACLPLWGAVSQAVPAAASSIAATVNGAVVTTAALDAAVRLATTLSGADTFDSRRRGEVFDNLIRRVAAVQEGTRRGFGASLAEVEAQKAFLAARFDSQEAFYFALDQNGISPATLQHEIEKDIIVSKLIQDEVSPHVHISDDDVRHYYDSNPHYFLVPERVHVRHILLRIPEAADADARKAIRSRLLSLRELLLGGGDFAVIAMEHSEDVSAENGGDIGFFSREDVAKGFADAAFSLSPDHISDVVTTPLGLHLIEQIEKTPETTAPFETVRLPLRRYLHRQATSLATKVFLDRLLSVSEVKRYAK